MSREHEEKKTYRWQVIIWKDAQQHISLGKYKLTQHWDITTHVLEWPKSEMLTSAGVDVEQQRLSLIACEILKCRNDFERPFRSFLQN